MNRKIYIASSWKNDLYPELVARITQETDHEVLDWRQNGFFWSDLEEPIDPEYVSHDEYVNNVAKDKCARRGFANDMAKLSLADTVILLLPCGNSAHLEFGWACARAKTAFIVTGEGFRPDLMYQMAGYMVPNIEDMIALLKGNA